ncbi:MAG: NAD(P)/FAD-dependent oxidoreductase [Desulfobulbaceae bacterium]|nr:NAD(P)/FAD-dependent oxidoreductase [Desulfobulbaceae bacterium]HIJ79513.1 NAD(P)/FAD-dependent oxidoreductase [Deltaproteobacteria bacterium]
MGDEPQQGRSYNVLPGTKMGVVTVDHLEKIAEVARKHEIPLVKVTSAQRIAFAGHPPEKVAEIWRDLGQAAGPKKPVGIHYIKACPGVLWCKYGRQDSLALGDKLEKALFSMPLPAKTKVGISGCPMNCCESYIRDLGIFGMKKGWTLVFGGNGGGVPRIGDVMAEGLDDEQVIELAGRCLKYFAEHARKFERTGRFMRRTDLETFKRAVGL